MQIIPPDATIAELEKKVAAYEEEAQKKSDAMAARLWEKRSCAVSGSPL
jgi:hypothetical protein